VAEPRYVPFYDFRDPTDTDHERKMKALSYEIQNIIINSSVAINLMHRLQFLLYQLAHVFALIFLLFYDFSNDLSTKNLLIVVVLVGTYQYLEFYLFIVFLIIVLPYYFMKNIYNYAIIKYRSYKLEQSLKSERFSEKLAGDRECKICLMTYEPGDSIIVLKCN
jgi:predicted membrane protein